MRRVKMHAAQRNQKLMDTVATLLEAGIAAASNDAPLAHLPKPVRLKARRPVTIAARAGGARRRAIRRIGL